MKTVQIKDGFFIQVEGDVSSPGVYSFGSQVVPGDVIEKAGGLLPSGDSSILSDNVVFESDVRIEIQRKVDGWGLFQREISSFHKLTLGIPISLNSESEGGLTALPGIGPSLARAIVEERARRGGFKKLKEITSINGIGEGIYKKIAPYVIL
ncbi:MAG: helix-hairpin-helix domain-containing protein [Deltaproteobacteria bacterium]|nr:helix-hairpin-helix domain-containing protein [Deltaproteobacteria bacterium]